MDIEERLCEMKSDERELAKASIKTAQMSGPKQNNSFPFNKSAERTAHHERFSDEYQSRNAQSQSNAGASQRLST
jgi:hypothetical protein